MSGGAEADRRLAGWTAGIARWLLCCLAALWVLGAQARDVPEAAPAALVQGFADAASYDPVSESVRVRGWLHEATGLAAPAQFQARIGSAAVRVLSAQRMPRPDVAQVLHLPPETPLGFELELSLPQYLGHQGVPVQLAVQWGDGRVVALPPSQGPASLDVARPGTPSKHVDIAWISAMAIAALGLLLWRGRARPATTGASTPRVSARWMVGASLVLFGVLVAGGVSGSSMGALLGTRDQPNSLLSSDSAVQRIAGSARSVRSDEWLVMTGNLLAQVNHVPPFPVVNSLLGGEGQNMMVVGMTGVPIAHASAVARPATWGFFVLPLRQALAWYWYLPVFACLLALWALLQQLATQRPLYHMALSVLFCLAPYAAGWSLWPLYVVAWACASLALALRMVRETAPARLLGWSVLLGWTMACLGLTLYPPWQITVATLCAAAFAAQLWDGRAALRWRWSMVGGFALAALLCALVMAAWWLDARTAIDAMRNTVYPGQRAALHGGDLPWPALLRGYGNLDTLSTLQYSVSNASELASYFLLILPLALLALRDAVRNRRFTGAAIAAFMGVVVLYGVAGFPLPLAKLIFWHYVPTNRLDLALGLASVLVMALLPPRDTAQGRGVYFSPPAAVAIALACAAIIAATLHATPADYNPRLSIVMLATLAACGAAMGYWWMRGYRRSAIALNLLLYLIAVAEFNPLVRAPRAVAINESLASALDLPRAPVSAPPFRRVLLLSDSTIASMGLAAAGVPVASGVFYYPQPALWHSMGLPQEQWPQVNRYQHLTFAIGAVGTGTYSIHNPSADTVRVVVSSAGFDFSTTGADVVGSPAAQVIRNPSLAPLGRHQDWNWYAVVKNR